MNFCFENIINSSKDTENENRKNALYRLFFLLWLSDEYSDSDQEVLKKYAASKKIKFHEKSVIVSAIIISLLRSFDQRKFHILFEFYDINEK